MSRYLLQVASRALGQIAVATPRIAPLFGDASVVPVDVGLTAPSTESAPGRVVARQPTLAPEAAQAHAASKREAEYPTEVVQPAQAPAPSDPVTRMPTARALQREAAVDAQPGTDAAMPSAPLQPAAPMAATLARGPYAAEAPARQYRIAEVDEDRREPESQPRTAKPIRSPSAPDAQSTLSIPTADPTPPRATIADTRAVPAERMRILPSAAATTTVRVGAPIAQNANAAGIAAPRELQAARAAVPMSSITARSGTSHGPAPNASQPPARADAATRTINVTIGRVEVRAVPAASSPAVLPRAPASPTPLDQLLRRNRAGS